MLILPSLRDLRESRWSNPALKAPGYFRKPTAAVSSRPTRLSG
jgi:hypothetical protein